MSSLKLLFQGIVIGIANIIPGVSGGTLAVLLGIYETLVHSVKKALDLRSFDLQSWKFLVIVGLGAIAGVGLFSGLITFLLEHYSLFTLWFFMGLIAGSLPFVYKQQKNPIFSSIKGGSFLLGFILVVLTFILPSGSKEAITQMTPLLRYLTLGFSGFVAGGAMIVPGISGSLILLILGSYHYIVSSVSEFQLGVLSVVAIGAGLGLVFFSLFMDRLLTRHHDLTLLAILGLITGSFVRLWPGLPLSSTGLISLFICTAGFLLAWLLSKTKPST